MGTIHQKVKLQLALNVKLVTIAQVVPELHALKVRAVPKVLQLQLHAQLGHIVQVYNSQLCTI